jgi:hypothetical protein
LSVDIADFGMGSDSPILLDYRPDVSNPAVIRLKLNPVLGETLASGRKRVVGWANVWLRCQRHRRQRHRRHHAQFKELALGTRHNKERIGACI